MRRVEQARLIETFQSIRALSTSSRLRRPQSFFERTSSSMAMSKDRSATIRFSLAFSSSSWRSRFIIEEA